MASLREEGLIQRPMSRAANGLSFEIVATEPQAGDYMFGPSDMAMRRPARLEKLERRRKKKKKAPQTEEEITAKLERAERRRKVRKSNVTFMSQDTDCSDFVYNCLWHVEVTYICI